MKIEFRQLSSDDGKDIYDMLQEIPKDENGFTNNVNGKTFEEFKQWLLRQEEIANGIGLEDWMVSSNTYWLYVDNVPVGMGKFRHCLTDKLREEGGHCGYAVRTSQRNKGYGNFIMRRLIEKARERNIDKLLLTIQISNIPSLKVALSCSGKIERSSEQRHYIWIDVEEKS